MKYFTFFIFFSQVCFFAFSQTNYSFNYDAKGNMLTKQSTGNSPMVSITGDTAICAGTTATFTASAQGAVSYQWQHGTQTASVQVQPQQTTIYRVTVTGANGCTTKKNWRVRVYPKPQPGSMAGDSLPFTGANYTYSLTPHTGSSYQWFVTAGNLISGYGTPSSVINWSGDTTGRVKAVEIDTRGCKSDTLYYPVTFSKTQQIPLQTGWNLFSTYINVANPAISSVFQSVNAQLLEVKDENYAYNDSAWQLFNTLTQITNGQGYWVKVSAPCTVSISGKVLRPSKVQLPLQTGWNLIGYPGQYGKQTQNAFASILPNVQMVKNTNQSYNPSYPAAFNTLTSVMPGIAYWIQVSTPIVFTYPAPNPSGIRLNEVDSLNLPPNWIPVVSTGSVVGYGKVTFNGQNVMEGDIIGTFVKGECRAVAVVNNDMGYSLAPMVINGAVPDTAEFQLYRNGQIYTSSFVLPLQAGSNIDTLLPLTFFDNSSIAPHESEVMEIYPNPFEEKLIVLFHLPQNEKALLSLYDAQGKRILEKELINMPQWEWKPSEDIAAGIYWLRLEVGEKQWLRKVIFVK